MTSKAGHTFTAGPATVLRSKRPSDGEYDFAVNCEGAPVIAEAFGRAADGEGSILPAEANANLIAEAFTVAHETGLTPRQLAERCADLLETLKQIRLWLAEEDCEEPLELADNALRAAGVTNVACPSCHGCGEWDEGPLPARSSAQIDPEYRQVKCTDCDATGRVAIAKVEGGAS